MRVSTNTRPYQLCWSDREMLCAFRPIKKPQYMLPHTLDFLAVMRPHCAPAQLNPFIVFLTPMTLMP